MTTSSDPAGPHPRTKMRHSTRGLMLALAGVVLAGTGAALFLNATPRSPGAPATIATQLPADTTAAPDCIVAYYFHTNYRCASCRKIEAYSKLAVESAFAAELASGRLQWRPVNLDDDGNAHFVDDYQLYTKSLILSERRSGREVRWKNLARVWELLGDEPAFVDYVQTETRTFLRDIP